MPTKLITLTGGGPWGFTLSGGKDFGSHLRVSKVRGRREWGVRSGHGEGEGRKQGWTWGGRGDEEQASWQLGKMRRERGQGRVEGRMECH